MNLKKWLPCAESLQALNFAATLAAVAGKPAWQPPQLGFELTKSPAVTVRPATV